MKKIISIILALILVISASPVSALADELKSTGETFISEDGKWQYYKSLDADGKTFLNLQLYLGDETEVVIPSRVDGFPVAAVYNTSEKNIFGNGHKDVEKITISKGIQRIGKWAFAFLDGISVEISNTVVSIGESAFQRTTFSAPLVIPEGVIGIEKYAFRWAIITNTDLVLPNSLKYLASGSMTIQNLTSLSIGKNTDFKGSNYTLGSVVIGDSKNDYLNLPAGGIKYIINTKNPYFITADNIVYTADYKYLISAKGEYDELIVPDKVQYISDGAFCKSKIGHLRIGSGVTFSNSTMLLVDSTVEHLDFDDDSPIESIGRYLLEQAKLTKLTLPKNIKKIEGTLEGIGLKELCFPEGCKLQSIGSSALRENDFEELDFSNCSNLETIDAWAVKDCKKLKRVNLSGTKVSTISICAFEGCTSLETVVLSEKTESIQNCAFENDVNLRYINLDSVREISESAFRGCQYITVPDNLLPIAENQTFGDYTYDEYENRITLTKYNGNEKNLVIPDEINGKRVTKIGPDFAYKDIDTLKLPAYLETLGWDAFDGCNIKSIAPMPSTLKRIEADAFSGNAFESIELNEGLLRIEDEAFWGCDNLTTLVIPDSVEYFGLRNSHGQMTVYFGTGVKETSLTNPHNQQCLPKSFYIKDGNPYYSSEQGILFNGDKTEIIKAINNCNMDEKDDVYVIPESVIKIDDEAFRFYRQGSEIVFGKNIREIGARAFMSSSFKKAVFKSGADIGKLNSTFLKSDAETVIFENGAKVKVLYRTFEDSALNNIVLPGGLEEIDYYAFSNTGLSGVVILPKTLKAIGQSAFFNTEITGIIIPDGVKRIGDRAFQSCDRLMYIDLNRVTLLGRLAFSGCKSLLLMDLTGVTFFEVGPAATFNDCPLLTKIIFKKKIAKTFIDEGACRNMESLETVVIGESVEEIRDEAFADCGNLEEAYISPEVNTISDSAFNNCKKLTIICALGSSAQRYAQKNGIKYKTFRVEPVAPQRYTGRAVTPVPKVCVGNTALGNNTDFTLKYDNNINPGTARINVIGMGDYDIYASTLNFDIVKAAKNAKTSVKRVTLKKAKAGKKSLTVYFKKLKGVTGYQVQIAKNKKFTKGKKTGHLKAGKKGKKSFKKLKTNKKYFVRVRAYKTVNGKKHYGKWSKIKAVKTK
ncbi:MAG: leucine-rich repeat protein [Eubacterium sp.]|nr:leucine-rich repeat protein [Eubacterium sp.]